MTAPLPPDDPLAAPASQAGWDDDAATAPAAELVPTAATPPATTEPVATLPVADRLAADQPAANPPTVAPPAVAPPLANLAAPPSTLRRSDDDSDDDSDGDSDSDGDDDDLPRRPRNRRAIAVSALAAAVGLAITALVVLGRVNSDRYFLVCEAERATPQQGRSFPPWGAHALSGEAWLPLKIAAETRCQPQEAGDPPALARLYLTMVLEQATAQLAAREADKIDDTEALLKQALLLTRPPEQESQPRAAERAERHSDVLRLLGDVTYWRASGKLRDAAAALAEAAKQFDSAAAQHPRYVSDAAVWASYTRALAQELRAGPAGASPPSASSAAAPSNAAPTAAPSVPASASAAPPTAAPPTAAAPTAEAPPSTPAPTGAAAPPSPASPTPAAPNAPAPPAPAPSAATGGVLL